MERLPYKDYTIKAKAKDHSVTEKILLKSGARYAGLDKQTDTYFQCDRGKLKLRQGILENLITHYERLDEKGIERTIVYRYDLNPTQDQITELFNLYAVAGMVKKERKIFYLGNTKIHLDTLPDGQNFIEIEAIDRTDRVDISFLKQQCLNVKELLDLRDEDLLKTGYFFP